MGVTEDGPSFDGLIARPFDCFTVIFLGCPPTGVVSPPPFARRKGILEADGCLEIRGFCRESTFATIFCVGLFDGVAVAAKLAPFRSL